MAVGVIKSLKPSQKHAFINDEVNGSQRNFLSILENGKDLYCKGDTASGTVANKVARILVMKQNGYKGPKHVCLNDNHLCSYSTVYDPDEECQYCNTEGSSYIKLFLLTYIPTYLWQIK